MKNNKGITQEQIKELADLVTAQDNEFNELIEEFENITPDAYIVAQDHYLDMDGSGPTYDDVMVICAIEAFALKCANIRIVKTFDICILISLDLLQPAKCDAHDYFADKLDIIAKSKSISECVTNFVDYFISALK